MHDILAYSKICCSEMPSNKFDTGSDDTELPKLDLGLDVTEVPTLTIKLCGETVTLQLFNPEKSDPPSAGYHSGHQALAHTMQYSFIPV